MRHPLRQPHHYIRDVGVLPDMQGQGSLAPHHGS
jgi:hypothetical protein